jgi:NAD(P)-dependent dehydrogenase (short-subunit alcohol dehydrogenase family)
VNIEGHTCLVTGANSGIGKATALELARRGAKVVLAGRSEARTIPVAEEIRSSGGEARFLRLDLSSLRAVKASAEEFLSWGEPLHVLINNAGTVRERKVTEDGFEYTFGVNYLGPYLFTRLLVPLLESSAGSRIVNVSSETHRSIASIDWDALHRRGSWVGLHEYRVSKLCNVLFTRELSRRLDGVAVVAVHPGFVATEIMRNVPTWVRSFSQRNALTSSEGARTSVHCATTSELVDGGYYANEQLREPGPGALDDHLAEELWTRSESWVRSYL